ncbi:MAG: glycosyltransferase [Planctomycetaceae bacterium]|nr:glycosyltransferase [Planctomycetaceae bacterium]MCB9950619.1 glycosyltransferase [Planctomycetaceae bacterium]
MNSPSSPHKIAFCITELDRGGAEQALVEIVTRLPREHWTPRVICLGPRGPLAEPLENAGIPVDSLGAKSRWDALVINRLRRNLAENRPEILQTFLFHANVAGRMAGWLAGVPNVISGFRVAEREKRWHNWVDGWTIRLARHHVAVSKGVAEFVQSQFRLPSDRLTVIPNGVDCETYRNAKPHDWTQLGLSRNAKVILAAGRLHPQKGFADLIEAATPLLKEFPDWCMVIAGEGAQRDSLQSQIDYSGMRGRILLPGWVDDLPGYFRAAPLFVLSSHWEGMPNVLLQAIAAGVPVVATAVEGVDELLGELAPEALVKPHSVDELRQKIRAQIVASGTSGASTNELQAIVQKQFTWNSVAQEYHELYLKFVN